MTREGGGRHLARGWLFAPCWKQLEALEESETNTMMSIIATSNECVWSIGHTYRYPFIYRLESSVIKRLKMDVRLPMNESDVMTC